MERTLLLVDDDQEIGAALSRLLRHDGYKILCARSGPEGLELLAKHEVHVIVSDQRMPGMSGVDFLSRAKELYPKTVRIILSGYADLSSVTDAINRGAIYKFLTKPWDNEILCANVLEAFRHYELTQQRSALAMEIQEANTTLASLSLDLSKLLATKDSHIEHLSLHDQLTNLSNRSLFLTRLDQAFAEARRADLQVALLLIDLRHFNSINDDFGQSAGDRLLQCVAGRLTSQVRREDTVARVGDNEFALILTGINHARDAKELAHKILDDFARDPADLNSMKINVDARIGISLYPADGLDADTLIKHAHTALQNAKDAEKSNVQVYANPHAPS